MGSDGSGFKFYQSQVEFFRFERSDPDLVVKCLGVSGVAWTTQPSFLHLTEVSSGLLTFGILDDALCSVSCS